MLAVPTMAELVLSALWQGGKVLQLRLAALVAMVVSGMGRLVALVGLVVD
tara:strand:- start:399 stop:548 length:150 start_codon:yes stop_codon:yes gene_type:complete